MATFTFGSGNARKLLRLPLYALGSLASRFVSRDDRLWAMGSGIGLGEGALPLYRAAREHVGSGRRIVWLAGSEAELAAARDAGLDAVLKHSRSGFRITLRARVLVITHGYGDVNRYGVRGAFVVQLWHGIPLKRLHLDSPATMRVSFLPDHRLLRSLLALAYRAAGRGLSLFPVSSSRIAPRIVSAFGIPAERVVVTGDVRDDVLLRGSRDDRRESARRRIEAAAGELPPGARIILYAPTWRDGAPDPGIPNPADWQAIAAWLEQRDAVLLVRSHPLGRGSYDAGPRLGGRIRLLGSDVLPDVTPALPAVDALVTDYSSIAYDFALTGGDLVLLAPDIERYARSRGLYEDYRAFSGGRHVETWPEALARLDEFEDRRSPAGTARGAETGPVDDVAARLVSDNFDLLDGRANERVLIEILRRTGASVPDSLTRLVEPSGDDRTADAGPAAAVGVEHGAGDAPRAPRRPVVVALELDAAAATLRLSIDPATHITAARLEGGRARVEGIFESSRHSLEPAVAATERRPEPGSASPDVPATQPVPVEFSLLATRWGTPGLALPSGEYRLVLEIDGDTGVRTTDRAIVTAPPGSARHPLFHADASEVAGGLVVSISAPLRDDERGPAAQRALERSYRSAPGDAEQAVFFESFYGRSASCNPLGIDRALAALRPDVTRYWSVADASVAIPEGGVRLIEGSREWWRVRRTARVIVANDWLRKRWKPRAYQTVLQTWHGTMLKRLALDRAGRDIRTRLAVLRERSRWDILLAQNDYSAGHFRSAYAFRGPIWVDGYPRNDVLAHPGAEALRERLGIPLEARVLLYAPTWRDDRTEMVDYLELESFAGRLGAETVLLVRGHSRTLPFGRDLDASGLIDVTTYPSMADLLAVSDVLITDYSSVMFDWATTGRPYVFFTPDVAHYSADLRGFYFDLLAEAPGPVARTREELLDVLTLPDADADRYAARRADWARRFAPHDDGGAGRRVVQRLIDAGALD